MAEINLVPEIAEEEIKKGGYKRKSNIVAILSLLFIGAVIGGLFAVQLALYGWRVKVDSDTKNAESYILSEKEKDINRRSLVEKLKRAESFLNTRIPYSAGVEELINVFKETSVVLKNVNFEKDDIVSISGEAANSADLDKLITSLISNKTAKTFSTVELVSLVGTKDKPYTFTIDFRFPPKAGWVPNEEGVSK